MDTTQQVAPMKRSSDRIVQAAPLEQSDEFAEVVAAISGAVPLVDGLQGYLGRNDNWRVPTAGGPELFVKRLRGEPAQVAARLSRLLAFEEIIAAHGDSGVPTVRFYGADRERGLLVFEHLPQSRTAAELLADDAFDETLAERLGRIVGNIHRLPQASLDIEELTGGRSIGAFYALTAEDYANCSGGEVEAWAMLQHDRELVEALDRLRGMSADAPTAATHCDIRLDQFLLTEPGDGDAQAASDAPTAPGDVHVIDWEEFRYSDPARDVGGFVGEFLHHAAARMFAELDVETGLTPGEAHQAIMAAGEVQLTRVRGLISRFWTAYREVAVPDDRLAVRATGYAGWHFFDRLLAGAVHGAKLSAVERGMAGIGRNALTEPERFASIIGLDRG